VDARLNLGAALVARGDIDVGIDQYREALKVAPDDFGVHYNLGNALLRKGDRAGAAAAYREALRLRPDFTPARQALADLE
jgi:Flp pilus assembly protein TadD